MSASAPESKRSGNYFDGLPVTGPHVALFFIIMAAYFFEQVDNWNFGFIAPVLLDSWHMTTADVGTINFFYFVGMTLGGLCGGIISDFIGRRKTFLLSICIFSSASVLNGMAGNVPLFIFARAMTGFGIFCLMVCSQTYIAEMAPAESRGKWQGLVAAVGFTAVPFIGFICRWVIEMGEESWRHIFYFGGAGFVALIVGLKYLKESPRWLMTRCRQEEAEKVVHDLTGTWVDLSDAGCRIPPKIPVLEVLTGMFRREYIGRTLVLITAFVTTTPASFLVTNWTATLLKEGMNFPPHDALLATSLISVGVPVGCLVSALISDKGGRKIPLIGLCLAAAALGLLFGNLPAVWPQGLLTFGRADLYWPIIFVGAPLTALCMAVGFVMFSYAAESYPTRMRNTAAGMHNALARFSVAGSQLVIPVLHGSGGLPLVYAAFVVMCLLPVPVVALWGRRTGGKSLEEVA